MEIIQSIIDFTLHIDEKLQFFVAEYGTLTYMILFLIVFVETGLIVMPLLPGDSLLFAAGALSAMPDSQLKIYIIIPLLICAALLGDNVNYFIGRFFSDQIKKRERILFFKRKYVEDTEAFYEKHGGKTVIMARFVPIVRTIAPFVAGASNMNYRRYILFCIGGAVLWVTSLSILGYLLGNNEFVKNHFEIVILVVIAISVLPIIIGFLRAKLSKKAA